MGHFFSRCCFWLMGILLVLGFAGCSQAPLKGKVNLTWPQPPDPPRIRFINEFTTPQQLGIKSRWYQKVHRFITGRKEKKNGLVSPYGICVDDRGDIYVTDTHFSSLHIFRRQRKRHEVITTINRIKLASPVGIAVDKQGKIFISDSLLNCVFVTDNMGKHIFTIGPDQFSRPTGLAVDNGLGRVYVVDTLGHSIKVFTMAGTFVKSFGKNGTGNGEFNFPVSICVDNQQRIIVADSMNFRIQILDREGNYLNSFGEAGDGTGYFSKMKGIAVDDKGNIFVCDAQFDVVQVFDTGGEFLLSFGKPGRLPGEFQFPAGICLDNRNMLYIVDKLNQRVQIFKVLGITDES